MITQKTHSIHPANTIPTTTRDNVQSSSSGASDWKAVGSPPRQGANDSGVHSGMLQPPPPNSIAFTPNNTTAASATPDHHHTSMSWLQQDYAFPPIRRNSAISTSASTAVTATATAAPPWANAMTLPTPSSSISTCSGTALFDHHRRRSSIATTHDYPDIASVPMLPEVSTEPYFREYRSMSFSMDASNDRDEIPAPPPHHHHQHHPRFPSHQQLGTMHEEEDDIQEEELLMSAAMDDEMLAQAQLRARSKSSAAAFNIWHPSHATEDTRSWMRFTQRRSSVAHAAPTPSYHPSVYSPLPAPSSSLLSNGDREHLAGLRRFSLSPMPEGRLQQSPIIPTTDPSALAYLGQRRHSLATPLPQSHTNASATTPNIDSLLEGMQALRTHDNNPATSLPMPTTPDDLSTQFPPENMGKGSLLSDIGEDALFCVVEFKRGRSDMYFTTMTGDAAPARNDFVIVEADRGHDLGKVTLDRISRSQLSAMIKQQQENGEDGNSNTSSNKKNDVHVKRILRRATSAEIALLMSKSQDEAKALLVCQSKIKQKQMPMQVVDAEYQWDKRKLTFYFVAERRVDFRELVRDLFKLYKTRIWMCAVSTNP
ncbi:PSP1-domain-containing protein [Lichtheimia hyalospora FSU 10163]|nr:PSP1-domain-containing protein [Lichtheimia hyalospora FSU 10163]